MPWVSTLRAPSRTSRGAAERARRGLPARPLRELICSRPSEDSDRLLVCDCGHARTVYTIPRYRDLSRWNVSWRAWTAFAALSLIWGIPYFFIKLAVAELSPLLVA